MKRLPFMSYSAKRMFFSLRAKPLQFPPAPSASLPQQKLIDEEKRPYYNYKSFYPGKPGEILSDNYQLLVKIGWGSSSTVWLARDMKRYIWQDERLVTLKILNNNVGGANDEYEIERYIAQRDPLHDGCGIMRTCLERFDVAGPEKNHLCLVYEPMRESIWNMQKRFADRRMPLLIAKLYIFILLVGIEYLHTACRVAHTDLKLENFLMTIGNEHILPDFIKKQLDTPMEYKTDPANGHTVYRCQENFGKLDWEQLKNMIPTISDFGMATRLEDDESKGKAFSLHPIQPNQYRAPEVILGCGWDLSTDIWNFGVLMWSFVEGRDLFRQVHDSQDRYDAKAHVAEMIALLGPPPKSLLEKSDSMLQYKWPHALRSWKDGKLCSNPREFFGGAFFDKDGKFLHDDLIPDRKLEDTVPSLPEDERQSFLSFVRHMLTWLPEERKTARELMEHPFLASVNLKEMSASDKP